MKIVTNEAIQLTEHYGDVMIKFAASENDINNDELALSDEVYDFCEALEEFTKRYQFKKIVATVDY